MVLRPAVHAVQRARLGVVPLRKVKVARYTEDRAEGAKGRGPYSDHSFNFNPGRMLDLRTYLFFHLLTYAVDLTLLAYFQIHK